MRITSLRVDLACYARRELADEPAAPRELIGRGWSTAGESARRSALELDLPRAPRAQVRAVDVTVHAPKDVSILWGLASESRARAIVEAHRRAVLGMLQWLERLDLAPRDRIVPVSGLLGVAAHHRLSRAKDPHLHSHSVLANALVADDGVHTLALERLRRVAPALELLYRVELRQGLAEVGVVLEGRGLGRWGVAGMPEGLADAFSQRRREVVARVGQHAGWRARELAALATRWHWGLEPAAIEVLQSQWRARLRGVALRPVAPGLEERRPVRVADPSSTRWRGGPSGSRHPRARTPLSALPCADCSCQYGPKGYSRGCRSSPTLDACTWTAPSLGPAPVSPWSDGSSLRVSSSRLAYWRCADATLYSSRTTSTPVSGESTWCCSGARSGRLASSLRSGDFAQAEQSPGGARCAPAGPERAA